MSNPPPSPTASLSSASLASVAKTPSNAPSISSAASTKKSTVAASVARTVSNLSVKSAATTAKTGSVAAAATAAPSVKSASSRKSSVAVEVVEEPSVAPPPPSDPVEPSPSPPSTKTVKKKGKKSPSKKTATGPAYPEGSWLNNDGYEASQAYQEMNGKVTIPSAATDKLKKKDLLTRKSDPSPTPPYQPGIPKALIGNVQDQDYPLSGGYQQPMPATPPSRYIEDYSVCSVCNLKIAGAPYCSATGKRHGISEASQRCSVVPKTVPIQRGAVGTIPVASSGEPSVEYTLETPPACSPEDRIPFTLSELQYPSVTSGGSGGRVSSSGAGPQFYSESAADILGGPRWDRVEELSGQYLASLGSPNTTHITAHVRDADGGSPGTVSSFPSPNRALVRRPDGSFTQNDISTLHTPKGSSPVPLLGVRNISPTRTRHTPPSLLVKMQARYPMEDPLHTFSPHSNYSPSLSPRSQRRTRL